MFAIIDPGTVAQLSPHFSKIGAKAKLSRSVDLPLIVLGVLCVSTPAFAEVEKPEAPREQSENPALIRNPTAHPHYATELEPHLVLDVIGEDHVGLGGRATFKIVDPGFVPTINDTVGIGVGFDWLSGSSSCPEVGLCHRYNQLYIPVVMQWSFWFTKQWSAFGEPGLALRIHERGNHNDADLEPVLGIGGRCNFTDKVALTLRFGVPEVSVGVSLFL